MAPTKRMRRRSIEHTFVVSRYLDGHSPQIMVILSEKFSKDTRVEVQVTEPDGKTYPATINWLATQKLRGQLDALVAKSAKES